MKNINAQVKLRLKENFKKDDPSEKSLDFILEFTSNSKKWLLKFTKNCYINRTSNMSGIIEDNNQENGSYLIINPLNSTTTKQSIESIEIPVDIDKIFSPGNFLYFDDKKIQFLINQDKSDSTYFETSTPYITINKQFIDRFFESIKNIVYENLFDELKNYDTITIYNY